MNCDKCGTSTSSEDAYTHGGLTLCEDCYLGILAAPKTCDPWAVHTAKSCKGGQLVLTAVQEEILDLLRSEGPLTAGRVCKKLGISDSEFRSGFASLRHLEFARGFNQDGEILYTLFDK